MHDLPYFVIVALLAMNLILLSFLLAEHQWESSIINWQHILSEIGFYLCLVLLLYVSSEGTHDAEENKVVGWTLIGLVLGVMLVNIVCIVIFTLAFLKKKMRKFCRNQKV